MVDRVMDRWLQQTGCEEDEEACDVYDTRHSQVAAEADEAEGRDEEMQEMQERYKQMRQRGQIAVWQAEGDRIRAARGAKEFRE